MSGRRSVDRVWANRARVVVRDRYPDSDDVDHLVDWVVDEALQAGLHAQAMRVHEVDAELARMLAVVEARFGATA